MHKILAFGFDQDDAAGTLRILVYDPNHPGDDGVAIEVSGTNRPEGPTISYLRGEDPVRGFFRSRYRPRPVKLPVRWPSPKWWSTMPPV